MFGAILSAVVTGFLIGSLARLALPGPDPMPFSLTVVIGLVGSAVGVGIATLSFGSSHTFDRSSHAFVTLMLEIGVSIVLVAAYRHFIQKRPLWGPGAYHFPERGFGVARMRERLRRLGIDPDRIHQRQGAAPAQLDPQHVADELERLRGERDSGKITDEQYEQARERLRRY